MIHAPSHKFSLLQPIEASIVPGSLNTAGLLFNANQAHPGAKQRQAQGADPTEAIEQHLARLEGQVLAQQGDQPFGLGRMHLKKGVEADLESAISETFQQPGATSQ